MKKIKNKLSQLWVPYQSTCLSIIDISSLDKKFFLILFLLKFFFLINYPMLIDGEGNAYYKMISRFQSSLIHASGYPFFQFFFSLPFFILKKFDVVVFDFSLYLSHILFSLFSLFVFIQCLKRFIHPAILYPLSFFFAMDFTNLTSMATTRPEFFQSSLILINLGLTSLFLKKEFRENNTFCIMLAFSLFALFITKFNGIFFGLPVLFILFLTKSNWRSFWKKALIMAKGFYIPLIFYLLFYHFPSTGTFHLTLEKGWIYLKKLNASKIPYDQRALPSQKFLILCHELPKEVDCCSHLFEHIYKYPESERIKYRKKFSSVLNETDPNVLAKRISQIENFDPKCYKRYHRHYNYLGLKESEKLISGVFFQSIALNLQKYIDHFFLILKDALFKFERHHLGYLLTFKPTEKWIPDLKGSGLSYIPLEDKKHIDLLPIQEQWDWMRISGPTKLRASTIKFYLLFTWPSLLFFSVFFFWSAIFASVLGFALSFKNKNINRDTIYLSLIGLLQFFLVSLFTAIFYYFREKEFIMIYPLIFFSIMCSFQTLYSLFDLKKQKARPCI